MSPVLKVVGQLLWPLIALFWLTLFYALVVIPNALLVGPLDDAYSWYQDRKPLERIGVIALGLVVFLYFGLTFPLLYFIAIPLFGLTVIAKGLGDYIESQAAEYQFWA